MSRPRFTPQERAQVLARQGNPFGPGNCWHCGVALDPEGGWHVDHHPVRWADIADQVCCGVRDGKDRGNLVPSCAGCNTGHRNERRGCCCGHSQCRCTRRGLWAAAAALLGLAALAAGAGWLRCAAGG